MHFVFD